MLLQKVFAPGGDEAVSVKAVGGTVYPALQAQTLRGLYQVLEEVVDLSVKRQVGRIYA